MTVTLSEINIKPFEVISLITKLFDYDDVPITQEIIDKHFLRLNVIHENFTDTDKILYESLLCFSQGLKMGSVLFIYLRLGKQINLDGQILKLPKIIAGEVWQV